MDTSPSSLAGWLDRCEADLVHPAVVADSLRRAGWSPVASDGVAEDYRRRFDEHPLGYAALLVSTGVAALALGGTAHTLVAGLHQPVHRHALAVWLSVLVCTLPFAAWAHWWAARVDRDDAVAVWSRPRRQLTVLLLWGCGIVGGLRLLAYSVQLIGYLVGAGWPVGASPLADTVNVAVVLAVAGPLGWWAHRFLHRFDGEDPTVVPATRRRAPGAPASPQPAPQ